MKTNKTIYRDVPEWDDIDVLDVSKDFLPKPEELVFKPKLRKVTIVLDEDSIVFFKDKANELNTSYQRMIRTLLNKYAQKMRTTNRMH